MSNEMNEKDQVTAAEETAEVTESQETKSAPAKAVEQKEVAKKEPHKRVLVGKVKSNKNDKTIVIRVETQVAHPLYKKYYKKSKSFMAHDENNECNVGDTVRVKESRPLSANKRWTLVEIIERAK